MCKFCFHYVCGVSWAFGFTRLAGLAAVGSAARPAVWYLAIGVALALLAVLLAVSLESAPLVAFDAEGRRFLARWAGPGLLQFWVLCSWLGAGTLLIVLSSIAAAVLWARGERLAGAFAPLAPLGGYAVMSIAKSVVGRSRPPLAEAYWTDALDPIRFAAWDPLSASFPSGHALQALVVYGYLAGVLPERMRLLGAGVAGVIVFLVGSSRVALGAHWPTDILSGWLLGAAWLLVLLGLRSACATIFPRPALSGEVRQ